jgi:hypothetical protein
MTVPTETVSLTIPHNGGFSALFHMILGGIALRRKLSLEALDDLQLAVENILAEDKSHIGDISMSVGIAEDDLQISLAPLTDPDLRETLVHGAVPAEAAGRCMDVCLLLRSLVDGFGVRELEADSYAVDLRKLIR